MAHGLVRIDLIFFAVVLILSFFFFKRKKKDSHGEVWSLGTHLNSSDCCLNEKTQLIVDPEITKSNTASLCHELVLVSFSQLKFVFFF